MKKGKIIAGGIIILLSLAACKNGAGAEEALTQGIVPTKAADGKGADKDMEPAKPTGQAGSENPAVEPFKEDVAEFFPGALSGEYKKTGNLPGNSVNEGFYCESEGYVYYANPENGMQLCREAVDGSEKKMLAEEQGTVLHINVLGDNVIYSGGTADAWEIKQVPVCGGTAETISEGFLGTATEEKLFFTTEDGVWSMNPDGTGKINIFREKGELGAGWWNTYGDFVLFVLGEKKGEKYKNTLYAVKWDGSEKYVLLKEENVMYPVIAGDILYYTDEKWKCHAFHLMTGGDFLLPLEKNCGRKVIAGDQLYYESGNKVIHEYSLTEGTERRIYPKEEKDAKTSFVNMFWFAGGRIYILKGKGEKKEDYGFIELAEEKAGTLQ